MLLPSARRALSGGRRQVSCLDVHPDGICVASSDEARRPLPCGRAVALHRVLVVGSNAAPALLCCMGFWYLFPDMPREGRGVSD